MCRNVQTTLGINLRPSLVKALTQLNFRTAPQAKNGNHFFLPTSQKIDGFIDFFLITNTGSDLLDVWWEFGGHSSHAEDEIPRAAPPLDPNRALRGNS